MSNLLVKSPLLVCICKSWLAAKSPTDRTPHFLFQQETPKRTGEKPPTSCRWWRSRSDSEACSEVIAAERSDRRTGKDRRQSHCDQPAVVSVSHKNFSPRDAGVGKVRHSFPTRLGKSINVVHAVDLFVCSQALARRIRCKRKGSECRTGPRGDGWRSQPHPGKSLMPSSSAFRHP
ncbi:hypothetical protein B0T21DRAFT_343046 [Apiosordaria backusii]|uniref:Secreted protein n=1 Tax=Apiosordaria backusii TaxID=314023 RepID=A0AA40EXJ1_9PEZI|nr:hypothetical protein B0T21DRAFT_343046 [Apiosordaria backusii]